jgi:hypothetical protein
MSRLESRIAEAEGLIRSLHQENVRLREALAERDTEGAGKKADGLEANKSIRMVALEAERDQVRSRLRSLLEAL